MKEVRKISRENVRKACISRNWYTRGDCEEYEHILSYVDNLERATTDELETIATDIKQHSNTDCEIKTIMFILANECCITFIEE